MPACECGRLPGPDEGSPTQGPPKKKQKIEEKTVVVLLHGLGVPGHLDPVRTKLAADLSAKKNVTVIAPARADSITASIEAQVNALYTDLQNNHKDSNLIIYGHSQGAVLAAYLWCMHGNNLKIKGVILDRGPLAGFDPLRPENAGKTSQLVDLLRIPLVAPLIPAYLKELINNFNQPGIQDLAPTSSVISSIVSKLSCIDIPVLLIRAQGKSLAAFYSKWRTLLNTLSISSLKDLFGDPNDGLISWNSQDLGGAVNANIARTGFKSAEESICLHGLLITDTSLATYYAKFLAKVRSCIKN